MKPLKVVMSAFGPYKDEIEVDFTKLGDNGIFLITGDTGSGKTTIFDAISFALFGEASGSRRENSSFRSDFASDDVSTFVRLDFVHKGVLYKIERFPRYMRKKKRGEGITSVGGDAILSYLDQIITGDKNVTDKCIEILGMNASQFKQIVMIAQGEFLELLLAKPKDRAEIFRHIFNTGIFKLISDNLKNLYLEKRRECEDNSLAIKNFVNGIQLENELLGDESTEQILELLEKEISKDVILEHELNDKKNMFFSEYQKVVKTISEGKIINDSIVSLKNYQEQLNILMKYEKNILEKEKIVQKNRAIWNIIMPIYFDKDRLVKEFNLKKAQLEENKKEFSEIMNQYESYLKEYKLIEKKEKSIREIQKSIEVLERKVILIDEIEKLSREIEDSYIKLEYCELANKKSVLVKIREFKQKSLEIDELKNKLLEQKDDYVLKNQRYLQKYDLFLSAQAGILASNLEEGNPCPVCGSKVHPCRAELIDEVSSKEELDIEKKELEEFYQKLEILRIDIVKKEKELELLKNDVVSVSEDELQKEILLLEKKFKGTTIVDSEINVQELEGKLQGLKISICDKKSLLNDECVREKILNKISDREIQIQELENKIRDIKNAYEENVHKKAQLESVIEMLSLDIVNLEKLLDKCEKEYVSSYQGLGYEKEEDYVSVRIEQKELEYLDKEVRTYFERLLEFRGKITTLEDVIDGKEKIDINGLEEQLIDINKKLQELEMSLKNINNKISNDKKIYDNIKDVSEKVTKIEREVMVYKDLSDTANGTITGKNKLEFEQYVQAMYFDQVIVLANKRFGYMTDDRYQLMRKKEAVKLSDKLGLELEVMDYYTGKRRDIRTLSGGESFKAALSLALGMSDTIQQFAGGVMIDAMFIDEGFGSLDEESLDQAMNAIMMLSQGNKIIGIISHVNELKDMIDKKIIVKKSSCGSMINLVL